MGETTTTTNGDVLMNSENGVGVGGGTPMTITSTGPFSGISRSMSVQAMRALYELKENNLLCDAIMILDDGTEIPVHRAILCASSSYFKALFTTSLNTKEKIRAHLKGVSSEMFHKLLAYIYLRQIEINHDNVFSLLVTADYLSILGVLDLCCKFLQDNLTPKNCIGVLKFSRNHFCHDLEQTVWRYIMKNFPLVSVESEELCTLALPELKEIINSDDLNVKSEEIVWEAILRWIEFDAANRKIHVVSLMKCIRLGLLDTQFFLEKVKEHPYVAASEESRPMIIETLKFLYDLEMITHRTRCVRIQGRRVNDGLSFIMMRKIDDINNNSRRDPIMIGSTDGAYYYPYDETEILTWFAQTRHVSSRLRDGEVVTPEIARPRVPHEILFAIGGWSGGSPTNYMETYDTRADRWVKVEEVDPTGPRAYHGTAVVGLKIYVIGGFDGMDYFNSCRCFDAVNKTWKEVAPMHSRRCYVSTAVLHEIIYAMGGYDGHHRQNTAEKYDHRANQWTLIAPMNMQRSDACACNLNGKIYITGGFNGTECMHSAEMYDPEINQWSLINPMRSRRSGVSCIAYHGHVYVIGGFNGISRMCSGEKYNPQSNTWTPIPDMYNPRSNFAIEVIDDMIFAIGGFNGVTTIYHVECYDEKSNEWYEATDMNIFRSALSACVIDGLPNVYDYIHKHRDRLMEEKRQKMIALENQRNGAGGVNQNNANNQENIAAAVNANMQQLNILQQLNANLNPAVMPVVPEQHQVQQQMEEDDQIPVQNDGGAEEDNDNNAQRDAQNV